MHDHKNYTSVNSLTAESFSSHGPWEVIVVTHSQHNPPDILAGSFSAMIFCCEILFYSTHDALRTHVAVTQISVTSILAVFFFFLLLPSQIKITVCDMRAITQRAPYRASFLKCKSARLNQLSLEL